jgi:regulator of protease activity HflC (stomatin/prohibitin superfamily)
MDALVILAVVLTPVVLAVMAVRIVPPARQDVVERFGRFHRILAPGHHVIVPLLDRVRSKVDMREQVHRTGPQPVISVDNVVLAIDTVLYYRVTDPRAVTYEISDPRQAVEQLAVTGLRNVIGGMDMDTVLGSRDQLNRQVQSVVDDRAMKWGVKVTRVEVNTIEAPPEARDPLLGRIRQLEAELRDLRQAAGLAPEGSPGSPTDDLSRTYDKREASG